MVAGRAAWGDVGGDPIVIPFPNRKYQVIVADPPWQYKNKKTGGSMKSGSAAKYPTMALNEICDLPVPDICEKNSILFLWGTTPLPRHSLEVMDARGFQFKTKIYWVKPRLGMGFWFRGGVEECLIGIRGNVKAFRCSKPNFIQAPVRKHSQKPEEFFELIEPELDRFGLTSRIELFARNTRPGWMVWGDEVPV
jgi:N6-adenosine-specific RNA methylase IME4